MVGAPRMVWPPVQEGSRTSEPSGSPRCPVWRVGDDRGQAHTADNIHRRPRTGYAAHERANPTAGTGRPRSERRQAERPGESITRRIGQYPLRKGADVAGWLVVQTRE